MQTINEYLNTMKANGLSKQTIKNVKRSLEMLDEFKPIDQCSKQDITNFIVSIQDHYKPSTLQIRKINIKQYFKDQGRADIVEHIKIKKVFTDIDNSKLLTVDDVNELIKATPSKKYKAIFAGLWETGARINELLSITMNDVVEGAHGYQVTIHSTKTSSRTGNGARKLLLIESAGYVRDYLNERTDNDNRLFAVGYDGVKLALKNAGKAIGRPGLYPHLLRHSKATDLVRSNTQESIIRQQLGWQPDSPMIKRYIHLSDAAVIEDQLRRSGIQKADQTEAKGLDKPESIIDKLQEANQKQAAELDLLQRQVKMLMELQRLDDKF